MAIEKLRKTLGISGSKMQLGEFNQEFLDALAQIWSRALEIELTGDDCAALLMAPFIAPNLKKYKIEIGIEPTGYFFICETEPLPEN